MSIRLNKETVHAVIEAARVQLPTFASLEQLMEPAYGIDPLGRHDTQQNQMAGRCRYKSWGKQHGINQHWTDK